MTGRKRKIGTLTIKAEVINGIENNRLDASAKHLAEYSHDKVSKKGR